MAPKQVHFRTLNAPEKSSPHFLAALQLAVHVIEPIRKGFVHFYLQNRNETFDKMEWLFLRELGKLFQALISAPPKVEENKDEDDEETAVPVDSEAFFMFFDMLLEQFKLPKKPKDATHATQILFDTIQKCCKTLPITGELWSNLLDSAALGLVAKQSIVGKTKLEDGQMLQRTKKEKLILPSPYTLKMFGEPKESTSLDQILKEFCSKQTYEYDFDEKDFDFEVKIPSFMGSNDAIGDDWSTTRTLQFVNLNGFLFIGVERLKEDGTLIETEIDFPKTLDLSKLCDDNIKGSKEFELCAGVLYDDDDYVTVLRNSAIISPEEEGAWQLMEQEEVIPMTEDDILEFLRGEGGEGPCGTLAVYKRCHERTHNDMNQVLSDIIISHVSGVLNVKKSFYYEEEVMEEEIIEE